MPVEIRCLLWDEHNEAHIAGHQVTPAEVEEVVFGPATHWGRDDRARVGRLVARGVTSASRYLVVVCDTPTASGKATR